MKVHGGIPGSEFYDETTRAGWDRRFSREVDFGVDWRGPDGQRGWRVSWVETTGEVYAYACRPFSTPDSGYHVLGITFVPEEVLRGWAILMNTNKNGTTTYLAGRLAACWTCDDCGRSDGTHDPEVEH